MTIQRLESQESGWPVFIGGLLLIASIASFMIAWLLGVELTIPSILFLAFVVFWFASHVWKPDRDTRRLPALKNPTTLMVSTEWFFHGSEENRWGVVDEAR